ncbi:TetR/AcrR family transcriptional regulator [Yinghuangia seranimata]|uniref:TetR/AcrR family transcriptional regulator n=1 Tax=Yinghuangia seranimata TaxID=408067 RepID=UPI00248AC74C|nr:TetR/AcrR family transcriptional regulator [Yinghuangia seranimata]MDI2131814.1 TetR/AcrR family transcriptional regulator [Yinghuangia seranimata]
MEQQEVHERAGGRRRGPSKGDLREQAILRTARGLLADKPLERITVDDLVSGAGISRPTFYFYFASKQAVFEALLDPVGDAIMDVADSWLTSPGGSREELHASLAGLAALWSAHGPLLKVVLREDATGALLECRDRMLGRLAANATARIDRDRAAGLAPDGPPAADLGALMVRLLTQALSDAIGPSGTDPVPPGLLDTLTVVVGRSIYGRTPSDPAPAG